MITRTLPPPPPISTLAAVTQLSLFLDFDGTLVEIAAGPDAIEVPGNLPSRLARLADYHEGRVALVSGRGLDNIAQHVGPLTIARAGSHGADRVDASGNPIGTAPVPLVGQTLSALATLAEIHGALLERKQHGAALHYRARPESGPAIDEAASAIASDFGLITKRGKCVIELVRPGADKAGAVRSFMDLPPFAGTMPVFIGDDVTDEDGFVAAIEFGGFGIAVGERPSRNARYTLNSVKEVYAWLNL
ncbi:trehalose-phosphatase [Pontixanthobacter gangjinensis]|uniref:Trehalose 6-phosphate phosphatase n=1 Tax=Pontixanthobacter gangjinensis TaxID=1028742 RepID=A0A6I4SM80_9SPHN|nr:trehalose-phosphatase [Pontixanthobacter gangjinensis]MXO56220.1 trehalose-phosphatase [Pontixanthobacter gangjinensis]